MEEVERGKFTPAVLTSTLVSCPEPATAMGMSTSPLELLATLRAMFPGGSHAICQCHDSLSMHQV